MFERATGWIRDAVGRGENFNLHQTQQALLGLSGGEGKGSLKVRERDGSGKLILLFDGATPTNVARQLERWCDSTEPAHYFMARHDSYRVNGHLVHRFQFQAGYDLPHLESGLLLPQDTRNGVYYYTIPKNGAQST